MWEKINGVFYRDRRLAWGVSLVILAIIGIIAMFLLSSLGNVVSIILMVIGYILYVALLLASYGWAVMRIKDKL